MKTDWWYHPSNLPSRFEGYEQILPERLDDLKGPGDGVLEIPTYIGRWDLADWKSRVGLYHELITSGHKAELEQHINRDHFVELWPYIRDRVCDGYRLPWEKRFPELWYRASVDVSIYDPRAEEPFRLKEGWMKRFRLT